MHVESCTIESMQVLIWVHEMYIVKHIPIKDLYVDTCSDDHLYIPRTFNCFEIWVFKVLVAKRLSKGPSSFNTAVTIVELCIIYTCWPL